MRAATESSSTYIAPVQKLTPRMLSACIARTALSTGELPTRSDGTCRRNGVDSALLNSSFIGAGVGIALPIADGGRGQRQRQPSRRLAALGETELVHAGCRVNLAAAESDADCNVSDGDEDDSPVLEHPRTRLTEQPRTRLTGEQQLLLYEWIDDMYGPLSGPPYPIAKDTFSKLQLRARDYAAEHGLSGAEAEWFTISQVERVKTRWHDHARLTEGELIRLLQDIEETLQVLEPELRSRAVGRARLSSDTVVKEQAECFALLYPCESFDAVAAKRKKQWNKFMQHVKCLRIKLRGLRRLRQDAAAQFGYTPDEAKFCDGFDLKGMQWEKREQELIDGFDGRCCDVCKELRPQWMRRVQLVTQELLNSWRKEKELARAELLQPFVGFYVCSRCIAPDRYELQANTLRFSAKNNAMPKLPPFLKTPFKDAWDAEIALVRLTIPCVEIKVLKTNSTLSKTHSVCCFARMLPNQQCQANLLTQVLAPPVLCAGLRT